jgi:hypothetical protein
VIVCLSTPWEWGGLNGREKVLQDTGGLFVVQGSVKGRLAVTVVLN